jgi:hypothetical protein
VSIRALTFFFLLLGAATLQAHNTSQKKIRTEYRSRHGARELTRISRYLSSATSIKSSCPASGENLAIPIKVEPITFECSELSKYPKDALSDELVPFCKELWETNGFTWQNMDSCTMVEANRYDVNFVPASEEEFEEESGYVRSTAEEQIAQLEDIQAKRSTWEVNCCEEDKKCLEAIKKVEIRFCLDEEARDNKSLGDECTEGPQFDFDFEEHQIMDDIQKTFRKNGRKKIGKLKKQWDIISGHVRISPYVWRESGNTYWETTDSLMRHEFSHACSRIKLQLYSNFNSKKKKVKKKVLQARSQFQNLAKYGYSYHYQSSYDFFDRLYSDTGFNNNFLECIYSVINYSSTTCDPFYSGAYLEEAWADAFAIMSAENISDVHPWDTCNRMRDSSHPYAVDTFECLLNTVPELKKKLGGHYLCPE